MRKGIPVLLGAIALLVLVLLLLRGPRKPEPIFEPTTLEEPAPESKIYPPLADQPAIFQGESDIAEQEVAPAEGGFVEGFARDEEGYGIPDVQVTAGVRTASHEWNAETDADGHYRLEPLEEGAIDIRFSHDKYVKTWLAEVPVSARDADVVMKLRGVISGVVLDKEGGDPITDFDIAVGFVRGGPGAMRFGPRGWMSDYDFKAPEGFHSETGQFTLTPDRLGKIALQASAWGYAKETISDIELANGEEIRDVEIRLSRGASIRGTVVAAASLKPVIGARVSFRGAPTVRRAPGLQAETGDDGSFVIMDLAAGEYLIDVEHSDFAPSGQNPVSLREGQEEQVTIRLESGGTVAGYVTVNGESASDLRLELFAGSRRELAATNEEGYYEITNLAAGRHRLRATRGKDRKWATVDIEPDHTTRRDFEFRAGNAIIEGYVAVNGEPVGQGDASIGLLSPSALNDGNVRGVSTDAYGFYRIDELAADAYVVSANVQGSLACTLVDVADGEMARVDLNIRTGTGTIAGTVSGPEEFGMPRVVVREASGTAPFSMDNALEVLSQGLAIGNCQRDGSFEIRDLPAGSYNVTTFCSIEFEGNLFRDILQASQIVTVEEGEVVEVHFEL